MNYTKEQLEKLPKWAQSEIKRLQGLTNTHLVEGLDKKPLMNNAQIEFATGHNKMNKVTVYVRSNGMIDVNSDSRLGQELVILPRAANSFYLTFIER